MEFSPRLHEELIAERAKAEKLCQAQAEDKVLMEQQLEHNALRDRGLALGARLVRWWTLPERDEKYKLSRVSSLPLEPDAEHQTQVRMKYRPSLRKDFKRMTPDETIVTYRLQDVSTGATTNFYDWAEFGRKDRIRYSDPGDPGTTPMPIELGSKQIAQVHDLLDLLESVEFNLPK